MALSQTDFLSAKQLPGHKGHKPSFKLQAFEISKYLCLHASFVVDLFPVQRSK